ncbi:hypothetical protein HDU80_008199 [Chytriomyces hyalinus]|nr:hypothetical protein HDU80_008199 [Chytriomyces hyalinus]
MAPPMEAIECQALKNLQQEEARALMAECSKDNDSKAYDSKDDDGNKFDGYKFDSNDNSDDEEKLRESNLEDFVLIPRMRKSIYTNRYIDRLQEFVKEDNFFVIFLRETLATTANEVFKNATVAFLMLGEDLVQSQEENSLEEMVLSPKTVGKTGLAMFKTNLSRFRDILQLDCFKPIIDFDKLGDDQDPGLRLSYLLNDASRAVHNVLHRLFLSRCDGKFG